MVIAVDLDGTLAHTLDYQPFDRCMIGPPVEKMLSRVKFWLAQGHTVIIFTARADMGFESKFYIKEWCRNYIGQELPITNEKTADIDVYFDDLAVAVERNTGRILGGCLENLEEET